MARAVHVEQHRVEPAAKLLRLAQLAEMIERAQDRFLEQIVTVGVLVFEPIVITGPPPLTTALPFLLLPPSPPSSSPLPCVRREPSAAAIQAGPPS